MKCGYAVKRNEELEARAKSRPYLFVPPALSGINSFLAGTGIRFYEKPLPIRSSRLCLELFNAYATYPSIELAAGAWLTYKDACRGSYVWEDRRHSLYLMDCIAEVRIYQPIRMGGFVNIGPYTFLEQEWLAKNLEWKGIEPSHLSMASDKLQAFLSEVFGIKKNTRVHLVVQISNVKEVKGDDYDR